MLKPKTPSTAEGVGAYGMRCELQRCTRDKTHTLGAWGGRLGGGDLRR